MLAMAADATHAKTLAPTTTPTTHKSLRHFCDFRHRVNVSIVDTAIIFPSDAGGEQASVHHFPPSPSGSGITALQRSVPLCRSGRPSKKPSDIFRPAAPLSPVPHPPSWSHPLPIFGRRRDDDAVERSGGRRTSVGRYSIYRILTTFQGLAWIKRSAISKMDTRIFSQHSHTSLQ